MPSPAMRGSVAPTLVHSRDSQFHPGFRFGQFSVHRCAPLVRLRVRIGHRAITSTRLAMLGNVPHSLHLHSIGQPFELQLECFEGFRE